MTNSTVPNPFALTNETALITGGGSGLGYGIASCLVKAGAKVVLVGRRESVLSAAAEELGSQASYVTHDITEMERAAELVERSAEAAESSVSILINNAGVHLKKWAVDTSPHEFNTVLQTHVVAAHALTQAVLPGMLERRHGNVLFTASMTSFIGMSQVVAYSAAKSAYVGMVRSLTTEVADKGVRVNAIAPGWIESPMLEQALQGDPDRKARILQRTPMTKFGQQEDVGWAVVYLCSPAAKFLSGVVLPVDGGACVGF
ncbi:2-dehydro-3-deoxy-D-gluconate 5-dehydrogenase [Planctomycetes bacterium CA13]|uniref:2-dehydro-3-deoxy-D-gluconate 5-dehydrogenase n=1 Tax=Novipirellula herctigrandis TaxID=2527986 RepID=A0A5C5Z8P6_9BACT|nr:2-dehydro-3-deoxy-D-gluconate 5-dehydrogenase [Planctomycetes bacterium CA13]